MSLIDECRVQGHVEILNRQVIFWRQVFFLVGNFSIGRNCYCGNSNS